VRHPELRLLLVHGGGYLPWQLGRLTHGSKVRPEFEGHSIDAGSILRNVTVDCLTHDPDVLRLLVERVGLERVVLGTDLPFDMASTNPVDTLVEAVGIAAAEQIMCKGPARLFGL
jgi:aminocarboxymuconate-semialdehyde decarboxylase